MSSKKERVLLAFMLLMQVLAFSQPPVGPSAPLRFRKVLIAAENFESAEVFDVDKDGKPDIVSGSFWYKGPDYRAKYFIGEQKRYGGEYYDDFSTIPMDVNEDGKMDFISGGWWGNTIRWWENRGKEAAWKEHVIATTGSVETTRAWDVDGDGVPEIVPNTPGKALVVYRKKKGDTAFTAFRIWDKQGHGLGFGDVDGDGRGDFVLADGWLQAPAAPFSDAWVFHREFSFGQAGVPIIVADVNKDGLVDLIVGQGHDYGLDWYEQKMEKRQRRWVKHAIDPFNSQFHALLWMDIDNDGQPELITGKRYRAHNEKDPGSFDPVGLYYYKWNGESFSKQVIAYGAPGEGKGTGIYFTISDLDGNGWKDVIVAGKDGLYVFYNEGNK
jgi:hypothetical protein